MVTIRKTILNNKEKIILWVALVYIAILISTVLLPISPIYKPYAWRDSGVFQYAGWQIVQGNVPYQDVWDHKPPIIFFVNALGLLISGNSSWGIWIIEGAFLCLAAWAGFSLIKKRLGLFSALVTTTIWLMSLPDVLSGGNLTNEYSLGIQFICLWAFSEFYSTNKFKKVGFILGVLFGILFFLKQNLIGLPVSIILVMIAANVRKRRFSIQEYTPILVGSLSVVLIVSCYFFVNNAFGDFFDQAFSYNFIYVKTSLSVKIVSMLTAFSTFNSTGLGTFALLGWALSFVLLISKNIGILVDQKLKILLLLGLINLPMEIIFVGFSGRNFGHYYTSLIPIFSIFTAVVFKLIDTGIQKYKIYQNYKILLSILIILGIIVPKITIPTRVNFYPFAKKDESQLTKQYAEGIAYLLENTKNTDTVLVLGAETGLNFYARRNAPTRFVYQYPLIKQDYWTEEMLQEFFADIEREKPAVIIDTTSTNDAFRFGTAGPVSGVYQSAEFMGRLYSNDYFVNYCHMDNDIYEWKIYKCQE